MSSGRGTAEAFERLVTLLTVAPAGTIAVAVCDGDRQARDVIGQLRGVLPGRVLEARLDERQRNPIDLVRSLASRRGDVACLLGFEQAAPDAWGYLNFQRDVLPAMQVSVVCFVTPALHRELATRAPNFYAFRSAVVELTRPLPATPRVFISSTVEDLRAYREAARDAAIGAELLPKMLEYFAASGDQPPLDKCLAEVAATDVLVVLVAHRYGWVPADQAGDEHKSITWLECERAVAEGREVLAFLLDEAHPWPEGQREEGRILTAIRQNQATPELLTSVQRNIARLRDFKRWLSDRAIRATFTTPQDLRGRVADALHDWRRRHAVPEPPAETRSPKRADPEKYLRTLRDATSHIEIRGLQVGTGQAHRFPIEDIYISLTTHADGGRDEARAGRGPAGRERPTSELAEAACEAAGSVPLQQALAHRRLLVVGDPGMGKTTFLWRVAYALAQTQLGENPAAAESRLNLPDAPFPVFVRLSDLATFLDADRSEAEAAATDDAPGWLPRFLAAVSRDSSWGLDEAFFRRHLEDGCCVLLDGLDETPDVRTRTRVARLITNTARTFDRSRFVVTSRPAAYAGDVLLADFTPARIDPLSDEAMETFLQRWCAALYADSPTAAAQHTAELLEALRGHRDIRRLAHNPVMLTALAVVYWNERRLPEQRADLYDSILLWLARSRERRPGRMPADRTLYLLAELALVMQRRDEGRAVQVPKRWAAEKLAADFGEVTRHTIDRAERFLDDEEPDSGIIVRRGHEVRFWHLTFQEYLAARAIASRLEPEQKTILLGDPKRLYETEWREVVLLLAGILHQQGRAKVDGLFQATLDDLGAKPELAAQARTAGLLGSILRDLAPFDFQPSDARYPKLLDDVMKIFDKRKSPSVPVEIRIAAADALGQAGDPRIDIRRDDYWATIPAGKFWMGAQSKKPRSRNHDAEAQEDETPHEVHLDAFRIARYPVTVGQFSQFVDQDGYADQRWWSAGGFGEWGTQPDDWEDQLKYPNRPVTDVSWFEASAFAAWCGCRLPTEAEWERAARGKEGRKFPWGDEPADPSRLNFNRNIGHVTPVGIYPLGNTPEGISDLAGNAWEWCRDWYGRDYYENSPRENPRGPDSGEYRVLRGGAWGYRADICRAAVRNGGHPEDRYGNVGFRLLFVLQNSQ